MQFESKKCDTNFAESEDNVWFLGPIGSLADALLPV